MYVTEDGQLIDSLDGRDIRAADLTTIATLPGDHNWQNAAAAYAAARVQGLAPTRIADALATFPGLAHRQERVAEHAGVLFINDSKATNADAAAKALSCHDNIFWIAGGIAKAGGITPLAPYFNRIRHAYLIGQDADAFADTLEAAGVAVTLYDELELAVEDATEDARTANLPAPCVLLSPAAASFDMFTSFEARGEAFRRAVQAIIHPPKEAAS